MKIYFSCQKCGTRYSADETYFSKRITCKKCQSQILVPYTKSTDQTYKIAVLEKRISRLRNAYKKLKLQQIEYEKDKIQLDNQKTHQQNEAEPNRQNSIANDVQTVETIPFETPVSHKSSKRILGVTIFIILLLFFIIILNIDSSSDESSKQHQKRIEQIETYRAMIEIESRYVKNNRINVRDEPTLNGKIIDNLTQGYKVFIKDDNKNWYEVLYGNPILPTNDEITSLQQVESYYSKGWIHKSVLTKDDPAIQSIGSSQTTAQNYEGVYNSEGNFRTRSMSAFETQIHKAVKREFDLNPEPKSENYPTTDSWIEAIDRVEDQCISNVAREYNMSKQLVIDIFLKGETLWVEDRIKLLKNK